VFLCSRCQSNWQHHSCFCWSVCSEAACKEREKQLDRRAEAVRKTDDALKQREERLHQRERALERSEAKHNQQTSLVQDQLRQLQASLAELSRLRDELNVRIQFALSLQTTSDKDTPVAGAGPSDAGQPSAKGDAVVAATLITAAQPAPRMSKLQAAMKIRGPSVPLQSQRKRPDPPVGQPPPPPPTATSKKRVRIDEQRAPIRGETHADYREPVAHGGERGWRNADYEAAERWRNGYSHDSTRHRREQGWESGGWKDRRWVDTDGRKKRRTEGPRGTEGNVQNGGIGLQSGPDRRPRVESMQRRGQDTKAAPWKSATGFTGGGSRIEQQHFASHTPAVRVLKPPIAP
jgi:TolA-binding protein